MEKSAVIETAAEKFSIDAGLLQQISTIKEGSHKNKNSEIPHLLFNYARELFFAYKAADAVVIRTCGETPQHDTDEREFT